MAIVGKDRSSPRFRMNRRVLTLILIVFTAYAFLPLYYVTVAATKSNNDLFSTFGLWFADDFNLWQNLRDLFTYNDGIYGRWLWNSTYYAGVSAIGAALFGSFAGYAFSKFEFRFKRFFFALILGAVMIPQTALVVPIFLLLTKVGLVDTPFAVILPSLVFAPGVYLMKVYIDDAVPSELIDAARIDGAGEFKIFFQIAFRLMSPGFVTVLLLAFVATWNNYFLPLVVLNSSANFPLTVGLSNWYQVATVGSGGAFLFSIILAGSLVSILPVIIAFLFMQRYWQGGLTSGGVKA